jgi:stress-induced morphogen
MPIAINELEKLIKASFPEAEVIIRDLAGDNDHYAVEIISTQFNGKSRVEQHKLVNKALDGCLGGQLHALSIKTTCKE